MNNFSLQNFLIVIPPVFQRMEERFADNLPWPYHLIPVLTGLIGLLIGSYLIEPYGALAKTTFPAICLIIGGFGGLILLGNMSDKKREE